MHRNHLVRGPGEGAVRGEVVVEEREGGAVLVDHRVRFIDDRTLGLHVDIDAANIGDEAGELRADDARIKRPGQVGALDRQLVPKLVDLDHVGHHAALRRLPDVAGDGDPRHPERRKGHQAPGARSGDV